MKEQLSELAGAIFNRFLSGGVLKAPQMRYISNDRGVANTFFSYLINNKKLNNGLEGEQYIYMLCYMSFGAGAFFCEKQWSLNLPMSDFSDTQLDSMFSTLSKDDAVSLGFDALGILIGSYNYNKILESLKAAFSEAYGKYQKLFEDENALRFLMQTFFNVGVTLVYERLG